MSVNYHSAAVRRKQDFAKKPWATIPIDRGINLITGKIKGESGKNDPMVAQSFRFDKKLLTPAVAMAWMKQHKKRFITFEAAPKSSLRGVTPARLAGAKLTSGGCEFKCYVGKRKRVYCGKIDKKCVLK